MRNLNQSCSVLLATISSLAITGCSIVTQDVFPNPLYSSASGTALTATRGAGFEAMTISSNGTTLTGSNIGAGGDNAQFTSTGSGFEITIPADASVTGVADTVNMNSGLFTNSVMNVFPTYTQEATLTTTSGQTMLIEKFGLSQDLNYSEYGLWLEPGAITTTTQTTGGVFAFGLQTATMPTTGTATYNGGAAGMATNTIAGTTTAGVFAGTATLTANFGTGAISGEISNINFSNTSSGGNISGTMNNITLSGGTISGSSFTGATIAASGSAGTGLDITGANAGRWGGGFYGPNAQEVAGTFSLSGGANNAKVIGSFGAKQ